VDFVSWIEFLIRVFGALIAVVLFLVGFGKEAWEREARQRDLDVPRGRPRRGRDLVIGKSGVARFDPVRCLAQGIRA
jgi:hypothetical protein